MRGVGFLQRIPRHARQWLAPGAVILLYHRVHRGERDPQLLSVSPENFAKHLEVIRRVGNPISLRQLSEGLKVGRLPRRAIAITFDDGYRDNFENARPLLERYETPATFFVASGYVGNGREYWWDVLDRIFLSAGRLPRQLDLEVGERRVGMDLNGDAVLSKTEARRLAPWDATHRDKPTARHLAYEAVSEALLSSPVRAREAALSALCAWAGVPENAPGDNAAMSEADVVAMSRSEFCEVGAHTANHPRLSAVPACEQEAEIASSKRDLERMTGAPIQSFAYPFGGKIDYTPHSVDVVRKAGFDVACSNYADVAWRHTDRFQLPRVLVRNWDEATFTRFLIRWL